MAYYKKDHTRMFLYDKDRKWLESYGVRFLSFEQSDKIAKNIKKFVRYPARFLDNVTVKSDINIGAPVLGENTVLIPGSVHDHENIVYSGEILEELVSNLLCLHLENSYLLSAIPECFGAFQVPEFSYEIFEHMYSGNMTTPFLILSNNMAICFYWDFDLQYSFLSTESESALKFMGFGDRRRWDNLFEGTYLNIVPPKQRHRYLVDKYVLPAMRREIKLKYNK